MKRAIALLVLSFVVPSVAHAADAGDCRNLLTLDEVAVAVGGAAELTSASKRGEVGTGPVENPAATGLQLGGGFVARRRRQPRRRADARACRHGARARSSQFPLAERREQHWTEQQQDFGGVHCSSLSPPKPSTVQPQVTGCVGEVKGAALYVGVASRMGRPTFDLAKRLFDEAAARL